MKSSEIRASHPDALAANACPSSCTSVNTATAPAIHAPRGNGYRSTNSTMNNQNPGLTDVGKPRTRSDPLERAARGRRSTPQV